MSFMTGSAGAERAKGSSRLASSSAKGVFRGSKRTCASRARWRLVRGQPAQRLSEHYQLECDFGMSILTIYNEGDPVFLCENHLSAITPKDSCFAGVRPIAESGKGHIEEAANNNSNREKAAEIAEEAQSAAAITTAMGTPSEAEQFAEENRANAHAGASEAAQAAASMPVSGDAGNVSPVDKSDAGEDRHSESISAPAPVAAAPAAAEKVADRAASRPRRRTTAAVAKTAARDVAYGNPAKALVDETIWNMAPGDLDAYRSALVQGKSPLEAAQAAGGQLAVVHRKINEYTAKIEPILSASQATISVVYAIDKPLEQAILEIIGNGAMAEAEKDGAVERLGTFQEQIKRGLEAIITPLQAYRIAREISERAASETHAGEIEQVKQAYRAVYARLRDALRAFVPEAREFEERLANLYAAKAEIEGVPASKILHSTVV